MKPIFTGQCLCGAVQFESTSKPSFQANCHCDDCRQSGGGVYSSFVFISLENLKICQGETSSYQHSSDSLMTKYFCPNCGSQLFTSNSNYPERRGIRVGVINDASLFKPMANVFTCQKLASTPLDPSVKAFDKMPS